MVLSRAGRVALGMAVLVGWSATQNISTIRRIAVTFGIDVQGHQRNPYGL